MVLKALILLGLIAASAAKHKDKHHGHHGGDANIETVWKLAKLDSAFNNADIGSGSLDKILPEYEGLFAPKVSCAQHSTSKNRRYDLHDVPIAECNKAVEKAWMGMHVTEMTYEDVFADKSGTSLMARVMFEGNVVGQPPVRFPFFYTFEFDDAGKITSYMLDMDSTPLTPNAVNVQTVWKLAKIYGQMNNADIGSGILSKLLPEYEGLYAPKVSCAQHTTSKLRRYDLIDVPVADCNEAAEKAWMGLHIKDMSFEDVFADESGTAVMARVMFQGNFPGDSLVRFPAYTTYKFDAAGKIASERVVMDSTPLTPNARNTQTVWQLAKVMSELDNADIGSGILAKLLPELQGFYAEKVRCAQHTTSTSRRYDLQDVPYSDCMSADKKVWTGLHITDITFANVFADDSGTAVMARAEFHGNVPGGLSVHFPVFFTYTFDNAGKITSLMSDMDDSSLATPPTPPELAEQYAIASSPSIALTFLVGFIAAALVTGGIAFLISKRSKRDPLLDDTSVI